MRHDAHHALARMKVCHLITRMIQGGAQENTLFTLQGLKRDTDWDIHLACGPETGEEGSFLKEVESLGITPRIIPNLYREISPWHDFLAYKQLWRHFQHEAFDIVHTHSSKAGVLGRVAARQAGVPLILHTIHGLAFDACQPTWKNILYVGTERFAERHTDATIAVCRKMADLAVEAETARESTTHTIYSGFPLAPFLSVTERPEDGRFVIGVVARLFPLKGHEDLMQLLPQLLPTRPDIHVHIVGDGPMRRDWQAWMDAHPEWGHRVTFTGRVAPDGVAKEVAKTDLLLHLSWREGLARVLPQAMAAGKPVCSYDVGGASEVVIPGETGWLAPIGDLKKITECLDAARAARELCRTMGRRGRVLAQSLFAVEHMQQRILELYRELSA